MRRPARSEDGFSMIEIAVAIVVLGVVLVAFLPMVVSSIHLAVQNQRIAEANQLVASELDSLRSSSSCLDGTTIATAGEFEIHTVGSSCATPLATVSVAVQRDGRVLAEAVTKIAIR